MRLRVVNGILAKKVTRFRVGIGASDETIDGGNYGFGSVFSSKAGASGEGTGIEDQSIDLIYGASMSGRVSP